MKKIKLARKLRLGTLTVRDLTAAVGGTEAPFPRETAQPSVCNVGCLPPKSNGCYTNGCPTETQPG